MLARTHFSQVFVRDRGRVSVMAARSASDLVQYYLEPVDLGMAVQRGCGCVASAGCQYWGVHETYD